MEDKIVIKKINKRYSEELYKIGLKSFEKEGWLDKRFFEDSLKRDAISYVAIKDRKVIGGIIADIFNKPQAWIFFFVIAKKYRRKGIGTKLLKKVERSLPKNYFLLIVDIEKKDYSGVNFYKKNGFNKQAGIKNWFGKRTKGLIYTKKLKR